MTMQMLTIAQIVVMFICYLAVFVGLPAITFGVRLKRFSLSFRMMTYLVIGNFFIINLVLFLELFHICNRFTLFVFTVIPYFCIWLHTHNINLAKWLTDQFLLFEKRSQGLVGAHTLRRNAGKRLLAWIKDCAKWFLEVVIKHAVEWLVFAGVMAVVWYLFGTNFITNFGYNASDMPVHNWWINGLAYNKPFIAGVYPMGYHVSIYYIHRMFSIDTYVLLRLWGLVNIYGVVTMLMAFLACVCKKHPFMPFIGALLYISPKFLNPALWIRFNSALPQEYSMIFILPAVVYLFTFFEERHNEIKRAEEAKRKLESEGVHYTTWDEIEGVDKERSEETEEGENSENSIELMTVDTVTATDTAPIDTSISTNKAPENKLTVEAKKTNDTAVQIRDVKSHRSLGRAEDRMMAKLARKKSSSAEERMREKVIRNRSTRDEDRMRAEVIRHREYMYRMQADWSDIAREFVEYGDEVEIDPETGEEVVLTTVSEITGGDLASESPAETTVEPFGESITETVDSSAEKAEVIKTAEGPEEKAEVLETVDSLTEKTEMSEEDLNNLVEDIIDFIVVENYSFIERRRSKILKNRAQSLQPSRFTRYLLEKYDAMSDSQMCLLLFALALSLSIAIHFYPSMVIFMMCVGIAIGYVGRIFRKQYFFSVLKAGILSIVLAVLPMLIAMAMGTPLQGSLGWGLSVMGVKSGNGSQVIANSGDDDVLDDMEYRATMESMGFKLNDEGLVVDDYGNVIDGTDMGSIDPAQQHQPTLGEKIKSKVDKTVSDIRYLPNSIGFYLEEYLLQKDEEGKFVVDGLPKAIYMLYGIVLLCGLANLWKHRDYGMQLISFLAGTGLMTLLFVARSLGLPQLMDANRCSYFYYYLLSALVVLGMDGLLTLVAGWVPSYALQWVLSAVAMGAFGYELYALDIVREPIYQESMEYNGAIECTTNILAENDNFTFTILSANDELRMVEERGYHYETIKLLKHMVLYDTQEYTAGSISDVAEAKPYDVYIPTKRIYVYIEKVPKDYFVEYEGSGQRISEEGARRPCPAYEATAVYMGEDRWICMSKMYYWAQAYMKLHPDDMYLYYEDDDFMCYCIEQNDYSLYNLSIDYGYNHCGEENLELYYDD